MLKVVFCWSDISGYMAACWRALATDKTIDLFVVAFQSQGEVAFADSLMQGIPCRLLGLKERNDFRIIEELVRNKNPDVIVLCGWMHEAYRRLLHVKAFKNVKFVMAMDTPWTGKFKQQLGRFLLRSYVKKMTHIVVPGERGWQYAIRLGAPSVKISKGVYGVDYQELSPLWKERNQMKWPKGFLFSGRFVKAKGVDILVKAYIDYHKKVKDPWPLVCCGSGSLESLLRGHAGIFNHGFVQPAEMKVLLRNAGAFILPSRFDPWPLAVVEAAASGLPIICTEACGSAVEVVRAEYSGLIVPSDDAAELALGMLKIHNSYEVLSKWGERSQQLAAPYSADLWASRWKILLSNKIDHFLEDN